LERPGQVPAVPTVGRFCQPGPRTFPVAGAALVVAAGDERPQKVAPRDKELGKPERRPYNRKAGVAQAEVA
jgi:hypothetical protein